MLCIAVLLMAMVLVLTEEYRNVRSESPQLEKSRQFLQRLKRHPNSVSIYVCRLVVKQFINHVCLFSICKCSLLINIVEFCSLIYYSALTKLAAVSKSIYVLSLSLSLSAVTHASVLRPTCWPNARDRRDGEVN